MRTEKKQEARSVNPVQAQIKSLSGAILTIIDATNPDPAQREAVKSLVKAEFRRKMDYVTDEWILRTFNIVKTPNVPLTSAWKTNPEDYTEEELKRLQDLEEEVVEVDGIEFAKDTLKDRVVVDGVEFEKEKVEPKIYPTPHSRAVFNGRYSALHDPEVSLTSTPHSHMARANETAEAEPDPFSKSSCKQCDNPNLKGMHTCGKKLRKAL
jgi:hypothetical protein